MLKYIGLLMFIGFQAQAAQLNCPADQAYMKATVLQESGCQSGLVLLDVETVCVDAASPVLASLQGQKKYEVCLKLQPDSTGTTWVARISSAVEAK